MKKVLSSVFVLSCLFWSVSAKADFDAVNYVTDQVTVANEFIQNGVRYVDGQMTELRELAKYDPRNLVDIEKDFIQIPKIPKIDTSIPNFLENVNDTEKTTENLEKNLISQINIESGDTTASDRKEFLDTKSKRMTDFANLYAKAFTTRTNLAREDFDSKERTSTQSIIKSSSTVDNRIIKRLNNIREMNTGYAEFVLTNKSQLYRNSKAEEKGD